MGWIGIPHSTALLPAAHKQPRAHGEWAWKRAARFIGRPIKRRCRRVAERISSVSARAAMGLGVAPLNNDWFERGQPVHRYYLEQFLKQHAADIRGHCLEFQEDSYTTRFGGMRVMQVDILHKALDARSEHATLITDLTQPNDLPSAVFDCIICTYVLHLVPDYHRVTTELHRLLRSNGVLLLAVPNISVTYPQYGEFWRFTEEGLRSVLARCFKRDAIEIQSFGNSLTAAGELRGLTVNEFTQRELAYHDPRYGLVLCARAVKH